MTTPIALSTMYFQRWADQGDLAPFFAQGRDMGFDRFELSHVLSREAVERVDARAIRIAAVHHPCPAEPPLAPGDRLTAVHPAARGRAAHALHRTIDTAARVGAAAVVVHLGHIEDDAARTFWRLDFELTSRHRAGQTGTPRYARVCADLAAWLEANEDVPVRRAIDALDGVVAHAASAGVRIGLETGKHPHELPRPAGARRILDAFGTRDLGAWLDTGHVGAQVNLGLVTFDAWFTAVGDRWVGAHCHDVVGLRDHLAPGAGHLDFAALLRHLPADVCLTCEVDWYLDPDEVRAGLQHVERALVEAGHPLATGGAPVL
jgi:sugar phosphate isomerase/epimerase